MVPGDCTVPVCVRCAIEERHNVHGEAGTTQEVVAGQVLAT